MTRYIALAVICVTMAACDLPSEIGAAQDGAIMIRLVHKSAYPSGASAVCAEPVSGYTDNNPAIPAGAAPGTYGPSRPGSYSASFMWGSSTFNLSYRLDAPAPGYKRTYTLPLVTYSSSVNRCLTGWQTGFTYRDDRM